MTRLSSTFTTKEKAYKQQIEAQRSEIDYYKMNLQAVVNLCKTGDVAKIETIINNVLSESNPPGALLQAFYNMREIATEAINKLPQTNPVV